MGYFHLTDRALLGLTGPDAKELLQGTFTQDISLLENQPLIYAAHLSPQGKLLHDIFLWQEEGWLYLDVFRPRLMELASALHRYQVGLRVEFHDMRDDFHLYASPEEGLRDPRLGHLGCRLYRRQPLPAESVSPVSAYHAWRIALGVPDAAIDNPAGKALPAELGLNHLNALSFTKGCYVGQEVTTRLHNRGSPKKRLYLCDYTGNAPAETPIRAAGAAVGWLGSHAEGTALAIIQTRAAEKDLAAGDIPLRNVRLPDYV
jgi:hypothetical protein